MNNKHNTRRGTKRESGKRVRKARKRIACQACNGRGKQIVPDMDGITLSDLAAAAGRSRSLVSRMISNRVALDQKRTNPKLDTMMAVCDAVKELTGYRLSLDALARVILAGVPVESLGRQRAR